MEKNRTASAAPRNGVNGGPNDEVRPAYLHWRVMETMPISDFGFEVCSSRPKEALTDPGPTQQRKIEPPYVGCYNIFKACRAKLSAFWHERPELAFLIVLILIFNAPVLFGTICTSMVFQPDAVRSGQWWRLFTHPFVHLTWYHLLLDGTAFLSLYCSLVENKILRRVSYIVGAAAGSLIASWVASSATSERGLCGLSGIAHGLMAVSALEMMTGDRTERNIGLISFALRIAKAAFEAVTGRMFFEFLSFGLLGNPVAVSHAWGILGGLIAMLVLRANERSARRPGSQRTAIPQQPCDLPRAVAVPTALPSRTSRAPALEY